MEKESCVAVYVRPPRPGAYILKIYAKDTQDDAPETAKKKKVCDYALLAKVASNACRLPFPHTRSTEYGRTKEVRRFNIRAVCREGTLRAIRGTVELCFASRDSNRPLPQLMGKLKSATSSADAMSNCIVPRSILNNREFVFSIFLPEAGEYALNIYAKNPQGGYNTFQRVSASWRFAVYGTGALPATFPYWASPNFKNFTNA
ncbi:unnamed protein product [Dibothriocephalus latus]|uniref:KY-like immunoglobulin-like domain-containing protein n=1 Tax=Dibothriocephalus latus TaxID=60516 RepID=A0A3P7MEV6_DIBLA|nr:unnamed protein product [Dibothriocephalus latus]